MVGILKEYVKAKIPDLGDALLNDIHDEISYDRRAKWAVEVEDTLQQLHNLGVVLGGDCKDRKRPYRQG